jgi:hypothetical protein
VAGVVLTGGVEGIKAGSVLGSEAAIGALASGYSSVVVDLGALLFKDEVPVEELTGSFFWVFEPKDEAVILSGLGVLLLFEGWKLILMGLGLGAGLFITAGCADGVTDGVFTGLKVLEFCCGGIVAEFA